MLAQTRKKKKTFAKKKASAKKSKKSYNRAIQWYFEAQKYKTNAKIETLKNEKETLQTGWLDYEKYEKIELLTKKIEKLQTNVVNFSKLVKIF